jgi:micrococcal nuclease
MCCAADECMRLFALAASALSVISAPNRLITESYRAVVIGVANGDTISVLHSNTPERIRLHGIDTPERKQPFYTQAKQFTGRQTA